MGDRLSEPLLPKSKSGKAPEYNADQVWSFKDSFSSLLGARPAPPPAPRAAKPRFDPDAFIDGAAYRTTLAEINRLKAWPESAVAAGQFELELGRIRVTAVINKDEGAVVALAGLAPRVSTAASQWAKVRQHNLEMPKLLKRLAYVDKIPGKDLTLIEKSPEWLAYDFALGAVPKPPVTTTGGCDQLATLRQKLVTSAENLALDYEKGAPTDEYYIERGKALGAELNLVLSKATDAAPKSAEMKDRLDELRREIDGLKAVRDTLTIKEKYEKGVRLLALAKQVNTMRAAPADPGAPAYYAAFKKIKSLVETAEGESGTDQPTVERKAAFTAAYAAIKLKLGSAAPDRFARATALLPDLEAKAKAVLAVKVTALKGVVAATARLSEDGDINKWIKSNDAISSIRDSAPDVLAQLTPDEQMSLLAALRADGMPAADTEPASPKRAMMRKLYNAMALEPAFAAQDKADRKAVIDTLMKDNKAEFKAARENWGVMTKEQRAALLQKVVDAHCAQIGRTKPGAGGPGAKSSFDFVDDAALSENGSYHPPPTDKIKINLAKPAFDDFELAIDLVFHENTHNYQYQLGTNVDSIAKDPPKTQAKMFKATWLAAEGYVESKENHEDYKSQPIELHAWAAGPESAQMLMDALDAP